MREIYLKAILTSGLFVICLIATISLARLSKKYLRKIVTKTTSETDDYIVKIITENIRPLGLVISCSIAWQALEIKGYLNTAFNILAKLIILILVVRVLNRVSIRLVKSWSQKLDDPAVRTMLRSLSPMIGASIWTIGIVFYLQNVGVQMAAIWAILSAGGIGAGLALKEPVQEFFEYITILLDKPFQDGQFIHINGIWAKVERVGVRSTRLRSINGEIIVMSNSNLTNGVISNYAEMEKRRLVHNLGVVYDTPYEKMKKIPDLIKAIVEETDNANFDRCHFIKFGNSSLDFELVYYIPNNNYLLAMGAQQKINLEIMRVFEEEKIDFAFPTQTINLSQQKDFITS